MSFPFRIALAQYLVVVLSLQRTTTGFRSLSAVLRRPSFVAWARPRSVVEDPDGPTPVIEQAKPEIVDPNDIEGLRDITDPKDLPHPIPHQPWRRGDTAGCEAPISAQWRRDAEEEIAKAVALVGGRVLDVTWFLTSVVVTLDDKVMPPQDFSKDRGPQIDIVDPGPPIYYDPADPNPEEIWADEDDILYERETEEEREEAKQRRHNMYAKVTEDDEDPNEPHIPDEEMRTVPLYMNKESRSEVAALVAEELAQFHAESEQPIDLETIKVDTASLSTIAQAILDALEPHEEKWRVLARHELILCSPNPAPDVVETQRQFDAYRDHHVVVETQDPFNSNRTLKGQLVDRNSMDLILNIQGRMVTVPLNFVKCVRLPPGRASALENEDEYDEEVVEEYLEDEDLQP